ncbi:putative GTP-binding protein 6 [Tenrec ecaudatus]|uniref:putative GTP-binding protein 6 n=1 Tax=Tenrec ecaudatus TaxID=94439 RepID=UPI003F5A485D
MWALRAALRAGLRLSRETRARPAVRPATPPPPPPPPGPVRALAAFGPRAPGPAGSGDGGWVPRAGARRAGARGEEPGDADSEGEEDEDEEEEEALLSREPLLPAGAQRVCLVHPDIKWGPRKPTLTRAEWQVAEARSLVHTLDGWSVVESLVVPTKTPDSRLVFGRGNLEQLTEKLRGSPEVTSVFLNVERMAPDTKKELEAAWGVQVFDRFTIVLHIFRCHARTKEARLQLALAEIPLLRADLKKDTSQLDRQGGGSRYIMSSGETFLQVQQRLLKDREARIRKALRKLTTKRRLLRRQRQRRELPTVAVVGYTNSGKTTLIRALTGDTAAQPRDQLFATLDVTAHAGALPSRLTVLYMDTIGFLSQLPHELVASFTATLEDVACADLIVHVRDVSHPETELQKASVLSALHSLHLPAPLLGALLEVHNKVDLVPGYRPAEPGVLAVSALHGQGLQGLQSALEAAVLKATGRRLVTLRIPLHGAQLSWLHRESAVQHVDVVPEEGAADVTAIMSNAAYGKFRKLFPQ